MTNYFIGYKQANGEYVYVNAINDFSISMTLNTVNAIDFLGEKMAKDVCNYLNLRDNTKHYLPLAVVTTVDEIINNENKDVEVNE